MTPEISWMRLGNGHVTVEINARPSSRKRGLLKIQPSGLVIGLASAPEKGHANRELIEFMAEIAGVPAASVSIIKGAVTRRKVIRIENASPPTVAAKLRELAGI
jgi:uncharacterized protein (TIGR00251 family)